jgi:hypothetical protein
MYDVICYSYFVARLSIGNVLDAVSREVAHTPAGFGHVIQSLLEILIGVGLAELAVHPNSKFYAYPRCGRRGDLHKPQLPALHLHCPVHGNAMQEIKEPDWKVLRRVHPLVLERFCERVLAEIDRVSRDGAKGHHARYLQIFRIIQQRDREIARLFDNPRRSHALTMLAQIRSQGLLTEDEFSSLSPETRGAIQMLLGAE